MAELALEIGKPVKKPATSRVASNLTIKRLIIFLFLIMAIGRLDAKSNHLFGLTLFMAVTN